jgi:hypothetical protein
MLTLTSRCDVASDARVDRVLADEKRDNSSSIRILRDSQWRRGVVFDHLEETVRSGACAFNSARASTVRPCFQYKPIATPGDANRRLMSS